MLCGLGDALANVVALAELLKSQSLAVVQDIMTGLQNVEGQSRSGRGAQLLFSRPQPAQGGKQLGASCRPRSRAQLEIVLHKSPQFNSLMAAERDRAEAASAARASGSASSSRCVKLLCCTMCVGARQEATFAAKLRVSS